MTSLLGAKALLSSSLIVPPNPVTGMILQPPYLDHNVMQRLCITLLPRVFVLHGTYQTLVFGAAGLDGRLERRRVADDTPFKERRRFELLSVYYWPPRVESSERLSYGKPSGRLGEETSGAYPPSIAEDKVPWVGGRFLC